jgi:hypothetical protein
MAVWSMDGGPAYHAHQGTCDDTVQQRIGGLVPTASQSLRDHLRDLAGASGCSGSAPAKVALTSLPRPSVAFRRATPARAS